MIANLRSFMNTLTTERHLRQPRVSKAITCAGHAGCRCGVVQRDFLFSYWCNVQSQLLFSEQALTLMQWCCVFVDPSLQTSAAGQHAVFNVQDFTVSGKRKAAVSAYSETADHIMLCSSQISTGRVGHFVSMTCWFKGRDCT